MYPFQIIQIFINNIIRRNYDWININNFSNFLKLKKNILEVKLIIDLFYVIILYDC